MHRLWLVLLTHWAELIGGEGSVPLTPSGASQPPSLVEGTSNSASDSADEASVGGGWCGGGGLLDAKGEAGCEADCGLPTWNQEASLRQAMMRAVAEPFQPGSGDESTIGSHAL